MYPVTPRGIGKKIQLGIMKTIEELKELNRHLTIELSEARNARDRAEAANRNKTVFLANMSHEIRTPLNAIIGFSDLMVTAGDEEERRTYAEVLESNCTLLLQLINDILDLAKIESGTLTFSEEKIGLNALLEQLTETMKIRITSGDVELSCITPPTECYICAERKMLSQVLINLLNNAIKFTDKGSICLRYEVHEEFLRFHVTDTGTGIPSDKVKEIFDRFVRLDTSKPGTGLGLSICQTIVERLGGNIGVESEPGKGATFWFTIPYHPVIG